MHHEKVSSFSLLIIAQHSLRMYLLDSIFAQGVLKNCNAYFQLPKDMHAESLWLILLHGRHIIMYEQMYTHKESQQGCLILASMIYVSLFIDLNRTHLGRSCKCLISTTKMKPVQSIFAHKEIVNMWLPLNKINSPSVLACHATA